MKTIILCGGMGTRLKEETEFRPKPMVYVGGKPLIWHIMKIYASHGYNEFILAMGYKADFIKEFFLNQKALTQDFTLDTKTHEVEYHQESAVDTDQFKITFVDTGLETLPGERLLMCKKYIPKGDQEFMVTYGDGVTDIDIKKLVVFHKRQGTIGTMTGVHPRSKYGLVKLGKESHVLEFEEKPLLSDWINGGYMVFNTSFFKYLRVGENEHAGLKRLAKKQELSLYRHNGFWYAVDTYKELDDLKHIWEQGNPPWKVWT